KRIKVRTRQKRQTEEQKSRRLLLLALVASAVLALIVFSGVGWWYGRYMNSDPGEQANAASSLQGEMQKQPKRLVAQFLAAETPEEVLNYIRRPALLKDQVATYYKDRMPEYRIREIRVGRGENLPRDYRAGDVILLDSSTLPFFLQRTSSYGYRLDWESFVGAGSMPWEQLIKEQPTTPQQIRVYASRSEFFNGRFDNEDKYLCLRLDDITRKHSLYGYLSKSHSDYLGIRGPLQNSSDLELILKVRYPQNPESNHQVEILEIVNQSWLMR
ncbi:MAG: hypothetical protein AAF514_08905, partial [Verrucomicrobiota bacterium]